MSRTFLKRFHDRFLRDRADGFVLTCPVPVLVVCVVGLKFVCVCVCVLKGYKGRYCSFYDTFFVNENRSILERENKTYLSKETRTAILSCVFALN